MTEIELPWTAPPLSLNHRRNRHAHAALVKDVRRDAFFTIKAARLGGPHAHVEVTLHFRPPDRRRRDVDNLVATQKVLCDAMIDAGLVSDDAPAYMTKHMPVIHEPGRPPRLWLVVELHDQGAAA